MQYRNTTLVEAQGSPSEAYKFDDIGAVRRFYLRDSLQARRQAAADFIGYSYLASGALDDIPASWIARVTPHPYPTPPLLPPAFGGRVPALAQNLWCTRITRTSGKGAGAAEAVANPGNPSAENVGKYAMCEVEIQWQAFKFWVKPDSAMLPLKPPGATGTDNPLYNPADPAASAPDEGDALRRGWGNSRYVEREIKPGGRVMPVMSGVFRFDATMVSREPILLQEPMFDVEYVHHVPWAAWTQAAWNVYGMAVNGHTFDGWPPGTLLFLNAEKETHIDILGQFTYAVKLHFRAVERLRRTTGNGYTAGTPLGWNAAFRPVAGGGGDYEYLSTDGGGAHGDPMRRQYLPFDPGRLFRPWPSVGYNNLFMSDLT